MDRDLFFILFDTIIGLILFLSYMKWLANPESFKIEMMILGILLLGLFLKMFIASKW